MTRNMDNHQTEEIHTPMQQLSLNDRRYFTSEPKARAINMRSEAFLIIAREKNVSTKRATEKPDHGAAKMLIFFENGEYRLITFTFQKESYTIQEIFEQENIPVTEDTYVQCMQNSHSIIDYFVVIGRTTTIEELIEKHPRLFRACFTKKGHKQNMS